MGFVRAMARRGLSLTMALLVAGAYVTLNPVAFFPVAAAAIIVLWLTSESLPRRSSILPASVGLLLCIGPLLLSLLLNGGESKDYLVPAAIGLLGGAACRLGAAAEDDVRFGRACSVGALAALIAFVSVMLVRGWNIPGAILSGVRLETGVHPNYLGLLALASLTLAVMSGRRWVIAVAAVAAVAQCLAVSSRAALLTTLLLIALSVWRERALILRRPILLISGFLAVLGLGLAFGGAASELVQRVFLVADPYRGLASGGSGRLVIWSSFLDLWAEHPVLGAGPSTTVTIAGEQLYSHNMLVDLLVEVGVLGLVAFLGYVLLALKAATAPHVGRTLSRACVAVVLCYFAYGLFEGRGLNIGNPLSCLFFLVTFMTIGRAYSGPSRRPVLEDPTSPGVWRNRSPRSARRPPPTRTPSAF